MPFNNSHTELSFLQKVAFFLYVRKLHYKALWTWSRLFYCFELIMIITSERPQRRRITVPTFSDNNDRFFTRCPAASRPPSLRKAGFVSGSGTILSFLLAWRPQKHEQLSPGVWGLARPGFVECTNIHMTWTGQWPSWMYTLHSSHTWVGSDRDFGRSTGYWDPDVFPSVSLGSEMGPEGWCGVWFNWRFCLQVLLELYGVVTSFLWGWRDICVCFWLNVDTATGNSEGIFILTAVPDHHSFTPKGWAVHVLI